MKCSEDLVKKAYKKLKCSVYFDKTQLLLRQQIVEFETASINEKINKIYSALTGGDDEWKQFQDTILNGISFKTFPKSLVPAHPRVTEGNAAQPPKAVLITNSVPETTNIEKVQYFINMSVEGHVLGVLWLLAIGWKLDKDLYDKAYGNRLRKLIIRELEENNNISYSPYLFEPYFQQYESWRDSALELAQNSISKDQDVVVFTMDFHRFFYSVDLNENAFDRIKKDTCLSEEREAGDTEETGNYNVKKWEERLNLFVQKVIEQYSTLFNNEFDGRKILPIGFLPSNVLGNWCLQRFDKAVADGWNPLYYGRYVDDIIIVDKVERNSDLYQLMNNPDPDAADNVLDYCLTQCSKWNGFLPQNEKDCKKYSLFIKIDNTIEKENTIEKKKIYQLNPIYNSVEESDSKIKLENAKVKVFYFKHGESNALLQCFRNQITHNKSEFRFLPEDEAVFDANDYSEIYDIDNKESINKLRGVDGISIDKFALSKLLGKYLRISGLINDKVENKFAQDIAKIYDRRVIIDNYITWEKVIEIFVVNRQFKSLGVFIKKVIDAIEHIQYNDNVNGKDGGREENLKKNLKDYLYVAWIRALALMWGAEAAKHIDSLRKCFNNKEKYEIDMYRRRYLLTRMYDKYIVPVLLDVLETEWIKKISDKEEVCLCDFNTILNKSCREEKDYFYYPYMVTMFDLYIQDLVMSKLGSDKKTNDEDANDEKTNSSDVINALKERYIKTNFNINDASIENAISIGEISEIEMPFISVGTEKQGKLKIAIANIELKFNNFENLVKGRPNRSYERYKSLSHIINSAIFEKADMLVLPEAGIPIEWLPTMARTCAKNNMALVAGIEHIIYKNNVYNYTAVILPYDEMGYRCAVLSLHLKNHYAPHELELIHGYRLEEVSGHGYELYHWKDCWFPVYCCFELASIRDRALFSSYADMLVAVEWNKDINYYSNLLEALSRDLHCYCVQVNSSDYGDSRITMPSKTEMKDIIKTKGGNNATVLVGTVDIERLREFQFKEYNLQKMNRDFKPTPPLFDKEIVKKKIQGELKNWLYNTKQTDL